MASSDLEQLCSHVNEKIGNIKKTLSLRNCGQEPTLKAVLNKIGDEIIVVNELLNKLELEIQYQEQTNNSLKELCESLEEDYKDVEHLKENIPSHLPQVTVAQSWYMKSRLTYGQINDVIKEMNKAVISKYKILHQPKKSMNSVARNLYHRFIDEETKDTKGRYFIVEADIKEFTTLKVDKKFHVLLNILRHCRRLSEVRGGGLTRYVIT
ncbi:PREDICTED: spindle and kinetochore-associated protein 1 isoform X2 [Mandrillus leucophaeus]|uniref:SKA complex subunit 1 n=4 Tax=Cercopithecinae TaxID=9528 RepID=A0A2K5N9E4_CERAT|nr:PREDICTED: spindle and kinetochore-associated protein 1 isoform X2 [Mandrillus leucophaeus]XP_025221177.1 spindle and kinetochore-associated protein 1 isoform X2 [Theropithecus gelada]